MMNQETATPSAKENQDQEVLGVVSVLDESGLRPKARLYRAETETTLSAPAQRKPIQLVFDFMQIPTQLSLF